METGLVVHRAPLWRARADFVIGAAIEDANEARTEQLWARRVRDYQFEMCCVTFFLYDVALGDVVETDANFLLTKVVRPSGRFVFRVWFEDLAGRDALIASLEELEAGFEWSSAHMLALDARDEAHAQALAARLAEAERAGGIEFETGRT